MSITISTCNQICNAPTNLSPSKQLYSFPKQERFLKRKTIQYYTPLFSCDKFYELKNTLSNRAAGFGYGHKYDFTKDLPHSPPPNSYDLPNPISAKKGFALGTGR